MCPLPPFRVINATYLLKHVHQNINPDRVHVWKGTLNAYQTTSERYEPEAHLPMKCVLNLAFHVCQMFQIRSLLV